MNSNNSALLIIDVQQGLFADEPRPYEADIIIERINTLTARARKANIPVVFVHHEQQTGLLEYGSDAWQLERQIVFLTEDVVLRKSTPDSFLGTELSDLLSTWGTKHVIICGYASEFCVDTTTRRAAALGFSVTLASDAHTTHDKKHASAAQIRRHQNATLPDITSFTGRIEAKAMSEIRF